MNISRLFTVCSASLALLGLCRPATAQDPFESKPQPENRKEKGDYQRQEKREKPQDRERDGDKFAAMKQKIGELHRDGQHEEAERLTRELKAAWEQRGGDRAGQPSRDQQVPEKFQHIQEAIKHLQAAGLQEPAAHIREMAEKMRAEEERDRQENFKKDRQGDGGKNATNDLRRELEKTRAELEKMGQELKELRSQIPK
jgi:hypothetical protein